MDYSLNTTRHFTQRKWSSKCMDAFSVSVIFNGRPAHFTSRNPLQYGLIMDLIFPPGMLSEPPMFGSSFQLLNDVVVSSLKL